MNIFKRRIIRRMSSFCASNYDNCSGNSTTSLEKGTDGKNSEHKVSSDLAEVSFHLTPDAITEIHPTHHAAMNYSLPIR